ncbi:hybrid sensor histidine kinase/response regulator [Anoxynatronum buryatiense]|uniref:Circadian input-output histidine kinase CikA n=1 Tax=Anoxynatronum buryatiense TaxID=489973 RepID=A0AA45WTN2_9CLOT|nr:PAS domain-containing hybrid sensor histidine kinase/response regulator [Anoxynatronum buryatiense]SMP41947.1 PAS domain S-box-containing protein [Anoxynatronum buryatiense]
MRKENRAQPTTELKSIWKELSRMTTEQALAENLEALQKVMTSQLKDMTQAVAVVFSLYDHHREVMTIQHIEASNAFLQKVVRILGNGVLHLETHVSKAEVASKRNQLVISFSSLTEATMGHIPPALSKTFHLLTGIDRFILIQHYLLDRLYGSSVIALTGEQSNPKWEVLDFYASFAAASLRRIEAEDVLKAEQARLSMVIEGTQAGIWEWNVETGENRVDQRWAEIIGQRVDEIVPQIETWRQLIHSEDHPIVEKALERVFNHHQEYYRVDFRMKHKKGHYVWVQSKGKVNAWSEDGKPLRLSGTHVDITPRKTAEKAVMAANEAKSRFLTHISHEIRTPLNGIMGFAKLLQQTETDGDQREYADLILLASEMLLAIVEDILDLSKIESGNITLRQQLFNLKDIVEAGTAPVKVQADAKNIEFSVNMSPQLPAHVVGDAVRVQQIIMNLTANAVKFTRKGSVRLTVNREGEATMSESGRAIISLIVEDTGIGMTQETLNQVFKPFYQADNDVVHQYGGTGLGLPITKELVALMEGTIEAESKSGVGTTMTVKIPFRLAESKSNRNNSDEDQMHAEQRNEIQEERLSRILVVEDQEANRKMLEFMLKKKGYSFEMANDGNEAVTMFKEADYSLILMDVQMPGMNGLEATRQIRSLMNKKSPKIVAVTAHVTEEDRRQCMDAGMDAFLEKPIDFHQLIATIDAHL